MATTRVMTTVLPFSVDANDPFHVSLYFSHRLEGGGTLADYPAMVNWVKVLREATFRLHTDSSLSEIDCTPLLDPDPDPSIVPPVESAWITAFPPTTQIRDFPKPTVTQNSWRSFPANRMRDHALDAHYASACSCPVNRPSVAGNPLAEATLDVFQDARPRNGVIRALRQYRAAAIDHRAVLTRDQDNDARAAVSPDRPTPAIFEPDVGPVVRVRDVITPQPWRSPIELLLADRELDADITAFLDRLVADPRLITTPMLQMLADVHAAQKYYNRTEEARKYEQRPIHGQKEPPRTPHASPDFHERAASTANVPTLARTLGFVVDVRVHDLDALRTATRIRCDVIVDGAEEYLSPETHCMTAGSRFLAKPTSDRWRTGRLALGDPDRYRVLDLDPDAAGLKLEQLLRDVVRALATEANGDRSTFAPAGLRATGFCVAELNRPDDLKTRLQQSEQLEPVVEVPGTAQSRHQFHYEGLLRGSRVEVWDDATKVWHSLHERRVDASFADAAILGGARDIGFLQNPPMNRVPGNENNPYYVHEVLAGWDGWSLSAPKPGKMVIHKDGEEDVTTNAEQVSDQAGQPPGIEVHSTAAQGSLPALRYGRKYSFRIAGVDLAGNSVPMDPLPTGQPDTPLVAAAQAHLDALRANVTQREQAGVFASLRDSGLARPRAPQAEGTPGEIERASASAVEHASAVRMNPQLDIEPEGLAGLFADSGDPQTVSTPRPFYRWDPIPAPTLVPRVAYTAGESLQRMVIRTGLVGDPGLCQRHVVPPKGSQMEAELDGRFDALMRAGNHARAYAIALKERGNLFHTRIQDLNSPTATIVQPGMALLATPGATGLVDLDDLQNPTNDPKHDKQPAEGQYIVHDVDNLVLPYLPDPMAHGVALVFYEAGADHRMANPRVLQSVAIKYAGQWPELQPLRLVLHTAPRLDAKQDGNVINVGLPPGEQVAVAFSTTLDADHLDKMALWKLHPVHDPNVPEADRDTLARAARDGWLWWLTPDESLRLVHATARPARPPMITRLLAQPRAADIPTANLDGVIDVHGASTEKVELRARWDDLIDDPATDETTLVSSKEIVVDHRIEEHERYSLLTLQSDAEHVGDRTSEVAVRTAIHKLPDTRARVVNYRLHGTSRYREFFAPTELPPADDPESAGNEVAVNIPSCAVPAPPVVHSVIPMFMWEQTSEPDHPFATRRIRRSGVRIWLERPWYSSGSGELLAVLTTGDPGLTPDEKVSLWARDPILAGPAMANSFEVPVLPAWQQRAAQLAMTPLEGPGRPVMHVVKQRKSDQFADRDKVVNAYMFKPEFHKGRKRWFVDVVLDSATAVWSFLRLSLARYQPNSIAGKEFSEVVATDFVQLPPERIATLSRPEADEVRITLTGVTAVTAEPGAEKPVAPTDSTSLRVGLAKSRRVSATLQARAAGAKSDLDWTDVRSVSCELAGVDATAFKASWTGALKLEPAEQLLTPGTSDDLRVLVEEFEVLAADPKPGERGLSTSERLVYADHVGL
ncbi:hypothetical protein A5724_20370 [Mycobacterium sp. ACS1612]|nr:hypothetical protein A5724_20370 [Mycobacterium sp. ACS1612]